jgi:RNA 3'-terminal phosphate cyclase (ATP)
MIRIDGSTGEGGGQMLRSALSLSLVTGKAFLMENIRAKRERSGLLRQHLTAVLAACEIASAQAEGATLGSKTLTFTPGPVRPGNYHFAIGTAGSGTLVFPSHICTCTQKPISKYSGVSRNAVMLITGLD